jgi:hypothetical protein
MSDQPSHPRDVEFWLRRLAEGDLTADETRRLGEAMAESESLRRAVEQDRALDGLLRRWAIAGPAPVADEFADGVLARIRPGGENAVAPSPVAAESPGDREDRRDAALDVLLARWARTAPAVGAASVADRVRTALETGEVAAGPRRPGPPRRAGRRLVIRIGLPLAAAAVVLLALTATLWFRGTGSGPSVVIYQRSSETMTRLASASPVPASAVSFHRGGGRNASADRSPSIGVSVIGVARVPSPVAESPPL